MSAEELVLALLVGAARRAVAAMRRPAFVAFRPLLDAVWEPAAEQWGWP